MAVTYDKIGTYTTVSGETEVTFSVPDTYTDIVAVVTGSTAVNGQDFRIRLGTSGGGVDTGSNYSTLRVGSNRTSGTAGAASSYTNTAATIIGTYFLVGGGNDQQTHIVNINNYAKTNKQKNVLIQGGDGEVEVLMVVGTWNNTGAIGLIRFLQAGTTWTTGSVLTIYGILRA